MVKGEVRDLIDPFAEVLRAKGVNRIISFFARKSSRSTYCHLVGWSQRLQIRFGIAVALAPSFAILI